MRSTPRRGRELWTNTVTPNYADGYSLTMAPLIIKDKVVVGVAGGEYGHPRLGRGVRAGDREGSLAVQHDPWPGRSGPRQLAEQVVGNGRRAVWLTGSYDPELNLTYWGVGNPGPDWNPKQREGDNLYSSSVIALDADTGKLKWHYQFTPNDGYDYDSVQIPVLVDMNWRGSPRKLMLWANRNGNFYVLDRTDRPVPARQAVREGELDERLHAERPADADAAASRDADVPGKPGRDQLVFALVQSAHRAVLRADLGQLRIDLRTAGCRVYSQAKLFGGGFPRPVVPVQGAPATPTLRRGAINNWTEAVSNGAVIAIDPQTGDRKWTYYMTDVTDSGVLSTASDLIFTGGREGYFQALNARTGELLWKMNLGGQMAAGPMSYQVDGRQYVAIASGRSIFSFALAGISETVRDSEFRASAHDSAATPRPLPRSVVWAARRRSRSRLDPLANDEFRVRRRCVRSADSPRRPTT